MHAYFKIAFWVKYKLVFKYLQRLGFISKKDHISKLKSIIQSSETWHNAICLFVCLIFLSHILANIPQGSSTTSPFSATSLLLCLQQLVKRLTSEVQQMHLKVKLVLRAEALLWLQPAGVGCTSWCRHQLVGASFPGGGCRCPSWWNSVVKVHSNNETRI